MNISEWVKENTISDTLLYKKAAYAQINEARRIGQLSRTEGSETETSVVSTHRSKSIELPVYQVSFGNCKLTWRDNFYNINAAVDSSFDLNIPEYFEISKADDYRFMEGIPNDSDYLSYKENKNKFSFCLWDFYDFYAFVKWLKAEAYSR